MKNVYEKFDEINAQPTLHDKLVTLRNNYDYTLGQVLKGTYDPNVEFVFDKIPDYKPSDAPPGLGYTSIAQELGRIYLFVKNSDRVSRDLTHKRKEEILIQILEALEAREAEVFAGILMKKQKLDLSYDELRKVIPNLLPELSNEETVS